MNCLDMDAVASVIEDKFVFVSEVSFFFKMFLGVPFIMLAVVYNLLARDVWRLFFIAGWQLISSNFIFIMLLLFLFAIVVFYLFV